MEEPREKRAHVRLERNRVDSRSAGPVKRSQLGCGVRGCYLVGDIAAQWPTAPGRIEAGLMENTFGLFVLVVAVVLDVDILVFVVRSFMTNTSRGQHNRWLLMFS